MKQLRFLTGRHAGMNLVLNASTYRISDDPEADIQITDWSDQTLDLTIREDEPDMSTAATYATYRLGPDSAAQALADLVPRRFGDIVLCLGPALGPAWPSDVDLLGRLLAPIVSEPAASAGPAAPKRYRLWTMCSLSVAALAIGVAFVTVISSSSQAAVQREQPSVLLRAQRAIEHLGVPGLTVRVEGDGVLVEGLVATPNDCAMVRAALSGLPAGAVHHRYAAASDVAQSIAEALSAPGIRVTYAGAGEFHVDGAAVGADGLQTAADRLVNDLAPLVRTIRVAVTDLPPPQRTPAGAMLHIAGMEYVQTRDGTKHISLLAAPVLELNDSLDGSNPPRAAGTHP
jgi:type III secretion protein D